MTLATPEDNGVINRTVIVRAEAVNDAPVLDASSITTAVLRFSKTAAAPSGQVGSLVSDLIDAGGTHNNFSDVDGDLPGIAITGVNLQGGSRYGISNDDGATWVDVGTVSDEAPRLLAADATTRLYFRPAANFNGTIGDVISFKAWDRNSEWKQLGVDLVGETAGDQFAGTGSISLSSDGLTLAVGSRLNDNNGTDAGKVQIYRWSTASDAWTQLGGDINGSQSGDIFGIRTALSSDGNTVAVSGVNNDDSFDNAGHVRIYQWDGSSWGLRGEAIEGAAAGDEFGLTVSLSSAGDIVAIGARKNDETGTDAGHARVFKWSAESNTWDQIGDAIGGQAAIDHAHVVSLSSDGYTVAFGARLNDDAGPDAGHVRVFRWNALTNQWQKIGGNINGAAEHNSFGATVSLSSNGNIIAIGAKANDTAGERAGHTKVYQLNDADSSWVQLGSDINGTAAGDLSGWQVSLSADGSTVVIGAPTNDTNGADAGEVKIYHWDPITLDWIQKTAGFFGDSPNDSFGTAVSISNDGTVFAAGSAKYGSAGENAGYLRAYRLTPLPNSLSASTDTISITVDSQNDAPSGSVTVDGIAEEDRVLTATNDLADIDGLGVIAYEWSRDGAAISGATASTYTLTQDDVGSTITATARYTDNDGTVETVTSSATSAVLNVNDAPTGDVAIDGSAIQNAVLSANTSTVQDEDGLGAFAYQWLRDGLPIASATSSTYTLTQDDVNAQISVRVDYTDNQSTAESLTSARTSAVVNVNDAPVLDPSASLHLPLVLEDSAAPSGQIGSLVSDLIDAGGTHNNFSDIDGDLPGIAITGTNLQGGALWYSTDDGATWLDVGAVSETEPQLLAADANTRLYFQPAADFSGSISDVISFKAWDRTVEWTQLGSDIDGEAAGDWSGLSVSHSADGRTVAVGAHYNDGDRVDAGHVRIYTWIGSSWTQMGADIDGEAAGDWSGYSVSLSADGQTVAIGARYNDGNGSDAGHVRIYSWTGTSWSQLGGDIDGEAAGDQSGLPVSLSADGRTVAIGAHYNNGNGFDSGHVRIYSWTGTAWSQLGGDIDGEAANDHLGLPVSLSADGQTVAIGARYNNGNGSESGHVRIYSWTGSSWVQIGADIDGEAAGDWSGSSVSLSADGQMVAIGARNNDGNGSDSGHVRIYSWTGSSWSQIGGDIDGEAAFDQSGRSVSLSADGQMVAIGARYNDGNGSDSGHVRIYSWTGASWNQVGADIDGEAVGDVSGWSVSLSTDGRTVAIGAHKNDGNGDWAGHVRIFHLNPAADSLSANSETVSVEVTAINDVPTFNPIADRVLPEDSQTQIIDITGITAGGGEAQPLQVTVTSSNASLISDPTITSEAVSVEGSRSLAFVPLPDQYGITTITVTVEDGGLDLDFNTPEDNAIFSRTFDVTVTPDTDNPPSPVTPHGRMFIHETLRGDSLVSYQLPAVNVNGEAINDLPTRVTVTSSNAALIPDPTVLYASADVPSSLSFTPVANANGTATLSIQVEDGGPDNDFATTEDNRQATHQVVVNVLEVISNRGSAILAKDSTENLYVNTQPVVYHDQQQAQSNIAGFAAIGATSEGGENALLVERASVTNRLVTDDAWRINGLFHSLQNESSPVLDLTAREVSSTLNVVVVAGAYEINGARNPTLIVRRGQIYNFKLNVANHPFYLQTTGNGFHPENAFNRFFQGQGRTEGEYMWIVPVDAPDELYYQCEFHPVMFGKIIVVD